MCTLTYIPLKEGGYLFTSNRDESPLRPAAIPPQRVIIGSQAVTFPKDPVGGGTWIATAQSLSACLLNGAFEPHRYRPPYARSRGLVLLEIFEYKDVPAFISKVRLDGVEPFQLVMVENGNRLIEMRWDGVGKHIRLGDATQPHIWASAQLYKPHYILKRREWFDEWLLRNPNPDLDSILAFHRHAGEGNLENDVVMNRGGRVQTLSITSIRHAAAGYVMQYHDLLNKQVVESKQ